LSVICVHDWHHLLQCSTVLPEKAVGETEGNAGQDLYICVLAFAGVVGMYDAVDLGGFTKAVINTVMYNKYIHLREEEYTPNDSLLDLAGVFQMFDSMSTVCLNMVLIKIPSQW
jgi:hypothetical protein